MAAVGSDQLSDGRKNLFTEVVCDTTLITEWIYASSHLFILERCETYKWLSLPLSGVSVSWYSRELAVTRHISPTRHSRINKHCSEILACL